MSTLTLQQSQGEFASWAVLAAVLAALLLGA